MAYKYYGKHSYKRASLMARLPRNADEVATKEYVDNTEVAAKEYVDTMYAKLRAQSLGMRNVFPYMYFANTENLPYTIEEGRRYYETHRPKQGGCSTIKFGNLIGRSFDWNYDEKASILLYAESSSLHRGSCGFAHNLDIFTEEFARRGIWPDELNVLPWLTLDGVNSSKVFVSMHVVSDLEGQITDTQPGAPRTPIYMLPRLILDGVDDIADIPTLCSQYSWWAWEGQEVQIFVSQGDEHLVVSVSNNVVKYYSNVEGEEFEAWPDDTCVALTNFKFSGWDGTLVYGLGDVEVDPTTSTLSSHAMGVERYDKIRQVVSDWDPDDPAIGVAYMTEHLMAPLHYTNAYTVPWLSEFSGEYPEELGGDLTIFRKAADYSALMEIVQRRYEERTRNGLTWYTKYSSVYDMEKGVLLVSDEDGHQEYFDITHF